jgi:hypothetical protein
MVGAAVLSARVSVVMVFLSVAIVYGTRLIPLPPRVVWTLVIAALIVSQTRAFIRVTNALDSTGERRFAEIGRYIASALPRDAIVFAVMHSGSVNYYSGRVTVRFDALQPDQFTALVSEFQRRGRPQFILLDIFEGRGLRQEVWSRRESRNARHDRVEAGSNRQAVSGRLRSRSALTVGARCQYAAHVQHPDCHAPRRADCAALL